jgi:ABC-2 type transport system permease protein
VVVLPQVFLCGLFQPRDEMAAVLRWVSDVLPVSYAVDALQRVAGGDVGGTYTRDLVIVAGFVVVALLLAAATLRRRTA